MTSTIKMRLALAAMLVIAGPVWSQEPATDLQQETGQAVESARQKADEIAEAVDRSAQAQDVSAGILTPIYKLAEMFAFPAFHWIAFAVMVAGVVSFALQLTLGKLMVLARSSFSPAEILSDALGLVVSLVGLVLTTQAAAENSNFTRSAFAVLSATAVGALAGFIFYLWGQKQELEAAEGRKKAVVVSVDEERL
ncbi:MAG: hypothetical protein ACYC6N_01680 [Pirellulaceae bacterium]